MKVLSKVSSSLQAVNELVEDWDLHIDEPHPHVHLAVRALSDEGRRFNIKKATLRHWRAQFAQHLRAQGVAANATERAVRDQRGSCPSCGGRHMAFESTMRLFTRVVPDSGYSELQVQASLVLNWLEDQRGLLLTG